jgi:ATP-dependent helicase/nuclease subunit A
MIYRIEYLLDNASSLSKIGYNLEMFIKYLEENLNDNSDIKIPGIKEDNDACSIMTIHKSKGLEFNICYYSGLYSKFNISDLKELFYYDNKYGFITPYFKDGINQTIYKHLLREKYVKEEIEEKLRLFYVALTRSKEKMIIVSDFNDDDSYDRENGIVSLSDRLKYRSLLDIILSVKDNLNPFVKNIDIDKIIDCNYISNKKINYSKLIKSSDIIINKNEINIMNKEVESTSYSKKVHNLLSSDDVEKLEFGKRIHYYLEVLDFKKPSFDNIEPFYHMKINNFLKQDILSDLNKSKIYKEYEFYL